jgi:hypothetical protein
MRPPHTADRRRTEMTIRQEVKSSGLHRRPIIFALVGIGIMAQPFFAANSDSGLLPPPTAAAGSDTRRVVTRIEDFDPFTHLASIPAGSDPASIRFEKVRATKVATERESTMDPGYCRDLQFRDPGGSAYCPSVREKSLSRAYEVTYSFTGQPLASDEYGNPHFTFQVYFRPEELPPALRTALSAGKVKRAEVAAYFRLATSRPPVSAVVLDEAHSSFCGGTYVDGNWIKKNPNCRDQVSFKTLSVPSDSIAVHVEPVSPPARQALVSGQ